MCRTPAGVDRIGVVGVTPDDVPALTTLRPSRRTEAEILETWIALLAGAADLPGAACRGRAQEFDADRDGESRDGREDRLDGAVAICRQCPALTDCADWLDRLPRRRWPTGVVAGRVIEATPAGTPRLRRPQIAQNAAEPVAASGDSQGRRVAPQRQLQKPADGERSAS